MMIHSKTHSKNFSQSLSFSFVGSALVLLLAGGFALYLMTQLGTAVERAIEEILPRTLEAMRLSENSALLAASAPSLTNARNPRETEQIAASLDELKKEIDHNVAKLEEPPRSDRLEQVRKDVAILTDTLSKLKSATNQRIELDERRASAVARIREVHNEFSDTVSPVVWGVSSLTRLFGKRAARANVASLKEIRDRHIERLLVLIELQRAYRELAKPEMSGIHPSYPRARDAFDKSWTRALELLQAPANNEDPLARKLIDHGEQFHAGWERRLRGAGSRRDPKFEAALNQAIDGAKDSLAQHFAAALKTAESTIADFVDRSVKDMGYALNIKAEGNLSFALLTAVADAHSQESVSGLQDRFKRSRAAFLISSNDFLRSLLSQRNPILASNVAEIETRLLSLGEGPDNVFDIRRAQLDVRAQIEQLLAGNRNIAALLKRHVERLVGEVQIEALRLGVQLDRIRGVNLALLILVFLVGLMLLVVIAYFSVRTLGKQERDIRQAAMVFESTGEGVIITDPHARMVAVNRAFCELTGYQQDETAGRSVRILRSIRHRKAFYEEMFESLAQTGRWEGEIYIRKKSGESDLEWLTINVVRDNHDRVSQFVAVFSDVAIVKRSLQKLDHLAHHDTLTGLPNRLLLRDRLEHAIHRAHRERRQLALLFLDLDRFKNINDTLGHTLGDHLLRIFADRLSSRIREGDTVARLGGDEFLILLEDYRIPEDARTVAQDILDSLARSFGIQGHELFVTASIGISVYPGDGLDADELVRNADAAMYRAKENGKNNYQFYTSELTVIARENLRLESSLRTALERDEFVLFYQPKWNTKTGEITGVEALLRWQHPERGLIDPAGFLSALEDSGLILPVGRWILQTACRQAQTWREHGLPAIQMSINLSGRQRVESSLLQTVTDSLTESGLDPSSLELELTEGFVMRQPEEVVQLLDALRALDVSIAIDDFGTGHSSLSYLKQLPIQKLKIDRSFVRDIPADENDMAITSAIIALGHRLQMSIVAEGVETEQQLAFLVDEGCEEAQGYLFSAPLCDNDVRPLLEHGFYSAGQTTTTTEA